MIENYMVSNLGMIKNSKSGKLLKYRVKKDGHIEYQLTYQKRKRYVGAHQLVALAFIPNPENKPEVHHIDGNPANNAVDNLMWVTRKEHSALHPERHKNAMDKCSKVILQFTLDGLLIREWCSTREIQRELGFWNANISRACRICKPYKGFKWEYKNEGYLSPL